MDVIAGIARRLYDLIRRARVRVDRAFDPPSDDLQHRQITEDIGIAMSDMAAITHIHAGSDILLPARLRDTGLDCEALEASASGLFEDMRRRCRTCTQWRQCARDLADVPGRHRDARYCPNAPFIARLSAKQP